jgi:hypothetical protein
MTGVSRRSHWSDVPDSYDFFDTRTTQATRVQVGTMAKRSQPTPPALDDLMSRADDFARREPATAVASAFGAGFLLNLLPLGGIAAALVGLVFSMVKPLLLFLGVLKACEFCRAQPATNPSHE